MIMWPVCFRRSCIVAAITLCVSLIGAVNGIGDGSSAGGGPPSLPEVRLRYTETYNGGPLPEEWRASYITLHTVSPNSSPPERWSFDSAFTSPHELAITETSPYAMASGKTTYQRVDDINQPNSSGTNTAVSEGTACVSAANCIAAFSSNRLNKDIVKLTVDGNMPMRLGIIVEHTVGVATLSNVPYSIDSGISRHEFTTSDDGIRGYYQVAIALNQYPVFSYSIHVGDDTIYEGSSQVPFDVDEIKSWTPYELPANQGNFYSDIVSSNFVSKSIGDCTNSTLNNYAYFSAITQCRLKVSDYAWIFLGD